MAKDQKMNLSDIDVLFAYADDVVIMKNSRKYVIQTSQKLLKSSKMMGLEVNKQKIKCMCISRIETDSTNLEVNTFSFEKVNQFKYLGVNLNSVNLMHEEIKQRLINAISVY